MKDNFLLTPELLKKYNCKSLRYAYEEYLDPYDPNLTTEQKRKVIERCRENILYFFRYVLRVPECNGDSSSYYFNLGTLAMMTHSNIPNSFVWVQLPRQSGATLTLLALSIYDRMFKGYNTKILDAYDYNQDKFSNYLNCKYYSIFEKLPKYIMKEYDTIKSNGKSSIYIDNAEKLTFSQFKDIEEKYDRAFFVSPILIDTDPLLLREIYTAYDTFIDFDIKIPKPEERVVKSRIIFSCNEIYTSEKIEEMKKILNDNKFINRELYMIRC